MKIAVYHNLHSGGAKRALFEMVQRLQGRHKIDVYTLSTAELDFCDLRPLVARHIVLPFNPLPVVRRPFGRLNRGARAADLLRLQFIQRGIARQIDEEDYDVAFVHHCRYGQAPALLRFLEMPSVYYCQEPPRYIYEPDAPRPYTQLTRLQRLGNVFDPFPGFYCKLLARIDRESVRAASMVLANSHYSRESLYRTYGIFARVCYLGVDVESFCPQDVADGGFVLSVGGLVPKKRFDFLIRSLALMNTEQRPPLIIVSNFADVREQDYLEELADRLGVTLSIRVGVSDEELVRLYNQAKFTLYAPVMEPFGFVPLESMACGTPVVGVREGGVRESVRHEETGLLVDRDLRQFAAAVEGLLVDVGRRAEMGRRGRTYVEENWSWRKTVCDLEAAFSDLLDDRAGEVPQ